MLTAHEQEALQMSTICSECRWGIFFREEHDGLTVRLEQPLCGHQSALTGRNYVTGEYVFKPCELINITGNCPLHEPKSDPNAENIISHNGVVFEGHDDGEESDDENDD